MKKIDSLNLIPFIDIMLVLLVIVLTTASFVAQEQVRVDIPNLEDGKADPMPNTNNQKTITITKEGEVYFDNAPTSLESLRSSLASLPKQTMIVIAGDKASFLETFIDITTILESLNLREVYVVVESNK